MASFDDFIGNKYFEYQYEYYNKEILSTEIEAERAVAEAAKVEVAEVKEKVLNEVKVPLEKIKGKVLNEVKVPLGKINTAAPATDADANRKFSLNLETLKNCSNENIIYVPFNTNDTLLKQPTNKTNLFASTSACSTTTSSRHHASTTTPELNPADMQNHIETLLRKPIGTGEKETTGGLQLSNLPGDDPRNNAFKAIKEKIKELKEKPGVQITRAAAGGGGRGESPSSLKGSISGGHNKDSIKTLTKLCMFLILIWFIYDESKMRLMIEGYYMIRKGYCFTFKEAMWSAIGLDNPVCTQYRVFVMSIFNLTIFDYLKYCFTGSSVALLVSQLNSLMDVVLDRGLDLIVYNENLGFKTNDVQLLLTDTTQGASGGGFPKVSRKISKTKKIRKKRKKGHKKTKQKKKRKSRLI